MSKIDEYGQAFSLDLMLALVLITIILGVSADTIDIASFKSSDYSARFSLERVTTDAADILIKTPGSPDNWEKYSANNFITPGLADIDPKTGKNIPNALSIRKVIALKNNYNSLIYGKILPQGVNSSLIIYPSDHSLDPIEIMKNNPKDAVEIAVANRTVNLNFMEIRAIIYNNNHKGNYSELICPNIDHSTNESAGKPKWSCKNFNITLSELNTTDFYIITDPEDIGDNAPIWILDHPEKGISNDEEKFSLVPININQKIMDLLGNDTKGVLWFHVRTPGNKDRNFDAYIVSVPKETPQEQVNVNNLNPEPWFFVLQVWY
ncbi:MAG: hypothetical protein ACPK7O_00595 [Methanobacterium sp.]